MIKEYIKHTHLRNLIDELCTREDVDEHLISNVIHEFEHSNLLIPGEVSDSSLDFVCICVDSKDYLPLFTDMDEFRKASTGRDANFFHFSIYLDIISCYDLRGIVINPESEGLVIEKEFFEDFSAEPFIPDLDDLKSPEELLEMKNSLNNKSLEHFIEDPYNAGDYEGLFLEISNSTLLTLRLSPKNFESENGIISMLEEGPQGFLHTDNIGGRYATLYTSTEKMDAITTRYNKYPQIINPAMLFYNILRDDMDGVIINPQSDDVLITRQTIFEYFDEIKATCNDECLNNGILYMFLNS